MRFAFKFDKTSEYRVTSISMLLFIDAVVDNQCKFTLPAVVALVKDFASSEIQTSMEGIKMEFKGTLNVKQQRSLICPYFLRHIKTHFYYQLINPNSTHIRDYTRDAINERLELNPVFLKYQEDEFKVTKLAKGENVIVEVSLDIGEMMIRYKFTLWQVLNRIWIEYLAVFVVLYLVGEKIKDYLFRNQYLAAWEVIPWKKLR